MSWEAISNIAPAKAALVPAKGVSVSVRRLGRKDGGETRYIRIVIGAALAKSLCIVTPEIGMRLSLGGGRACRSDRAVGRQQPWHVPREEGQGWQLCPDHQCGQRGRSILARVRAVRGRGVDRPCPQRAAHGGVPGVRRHAGGGLKHG